MLEKENLDHLLHFYIVYQEEKFKKKSFFQIEFPSFEANKSKTLRSVTFNSLIYTGQGIFK